MATEITIVRHGETTWNVEKRIQGHSNSKLTENGVLQAELVGNALAKRQFNVLISSDLERAAETAKIINKTLLLPHEYNPNLRERSFGIMEGKTFLKLNNNFLKSTKPTKKDKQITSFLKGKALNSFLNV
jgi:probable phosphoglycerate mutase